MENPYIKLQISNPYIAIIKPLLINNIRNTGILINIANNLIKLKYFIFFSANIKESKGAENIKKIKLKRYIFTKSE